MHFVYFTRNIFDLHALSTAASVALLVGAVLGYISAFWQIRNYLIDRDRRRSRPPDG